LRKSCGRKGGREFGWVDDEGKQWEWIMVEKIEIALGVMMDQWRMRR
jgi:hypothetical protein